MNDIEALSALLARVSKSSRAWRKRRHIYTALMLFHHCVKFGFPSDAEQQMWMSLLLWSAPMNWAHGGASNG